MHTLTEKTIKNSRLEFHVPGRQKELIEDAARLQGVSVSDFLASAAHREAVRVLQDSAAPFSSAAKTAPALWRRYCHPPRPPPLCEG